MSNKVFSEKCFEIKHNEYVNCIAEQTRSGFRHIAIHRKDSVEVARTKCCYQNRTWESFEFESVLRKLLEGNDNAKELLQKFSGRVAEERQQADKTFGAILAIGELLNRNETTKDKNSFKKRMLKARYEKQGLQFPDNFDELSEEEQTRRLEAVIKLSTGEEQ